MDQTICRVRCRCAAKKRPAIATHVEGRNVGLFKAVRGAPAARVNMGTSLILDGDDIIRLPQTRSQRTSGQQPPASVHGSQPIFVDGTIVFLVISGSSKRPPWKTCRQQPLPRLTCTGNRLDAIVKYHHHFALRRVALGACLAWAGRRHISRFACGLHEKELPIPLARGTL